MSTDKLIESVILAEEENKIEYTLSTLSGNQYIPQAALAIEIFGIVTAEIGGLDLDNGIMMSKYKTGLWRSLIGTRSIDGRFIDAVTIQRLRQQFNTQEAKKNALQNAMGTFGIGAPPKSEQ